MTLLVGLFVGGAVASIGLYWQSMEELDELFDDRLKVIANNLTPQSLAQQAQVHLTEEDDDIVIQLWSREGLLTYASDLEDRAPIPAVAGATELLSGDDEWHMYSIATPDGGWLQVAQALSARKEMAAISAGRLLLPLLLILPLIGLFTAWAVSRLLRPLRSLAEQLQRHGAAKRSQVKVDSVPRELTPVIDALNDLLARQAEAAQRQQAFLADAAHELRTPLAVVSLQVQRVQGAVSHSDRREAIDALKLGVDRASRLVAQLLALARSEPDTPQERCFATLDLEVLLKTVLAELYPLAAQKRVDLGLDESQSLSIHSDGEGLRSLLTNLLDNAIRHTPPGGKVDVSLKRAESYAELTVCDTGPGIAPERRQAVFERFVRDGTADSSGTGLGLAIVRQVVERHGGSITLEDGPDGSGLLVRVRLPFAE
ncbi:MAG: ATP-binding protein [Stagnimonas sp.]|nr:ATP-binding protein [Stagnimonas sp.]